MKNNKLLSIVVLVMLPIFYFILNIAAVTSMSEVKRFIERNILADSSGFLNVIYNDDNPRTDPRNVLNNLGRYGDSLNFNAIQIYGNWHSGAFNEPIGNYENYVDEIMDSVAGRNLLGIYSREKFAVLCNTQRVTYEVSPSLNDKTVNNGFVYLDRDSSVCEYEIDSGRTVLHSSIADNVPGFIGSSIYENIQHSDLLELGESHGDEKDWFLRPVFRIKESDFDSSDTRPVVAITIKNFNGDTIRTTILRVNNFKNDSGRYEGGYIDKFNFRGLEDSLLVSGSSSNPLGLNYGANNYPYWQKEENCQVDFEIYWHGLVDVWFDKLTVQSENANIFFNSDTAISYPYERKIIEEVNAFWPNPGMLTFFVDELVYSHIEATGKVIEIIRTKTNHPDAQLMMCLATTRNCYGMRNDTLALHVLTDELDVKTVMLDAHEITGGKVPVVFNNTPGYPSQWNSSGNNEYNSVLQNRVFGDRTSRTDESVWGASPDKNFLPTPFGSLVYQLELGKRVTVPNGIRMIAQPQLGMFALKHTSSGLYDMWSEREPTNEEIEAQAGLSIAHGADGLSWFLYPSYKKIFTNYDGNHLFVNTDTIPAALDSLHILNLLDYDISNSKLRKANVYGQDKIGYLKRMNQKILHWKPRLDSITWQSGYSLHAEGIGHEYISDIRSLYRDPVSPSVFPIQNDDATKYWEMGFFTPDKPNDRSKYFIMVNRRCVPDINQTGDVRKLMIKFDSTQLAGFNNWTITELDSNQTVATFDRRSGSYIDFDIFQPGEGKLYKLAPVMQEGQPSFSEYLLEQD